MHLPPELLDEIISHLLCSRDGGRSFRNSSLVAKSWIHPSQRRLFANVYIHSNNLQAWLNSISPTNVELLGHVRALTCEVVDPTDHIRDYSFHQLRSLKFLWTSLPLQQLESFSAFQHTLGCIRLESCEVTPGAFVTLINYFPNLKELHLGALYYHKEEEQVPPLSQPLLERISVVGFNNPNNIDLLEQLSELGLKFEEVVILHRVTTNPGPMFAKRVVDAFGADAKRLRLQTARECMHQTLPYGSLHDMPQLFYRFEGQSDALALPKASQARDRCARGRGTSSHFIHNLYGHSRDNTQERARAPGSPGGTSLLGSAR